MGMYFIWPFGKSLEKVTWLIVYFPILFYMSSSTWVFSFNVSFRWYQNLVNVSVFFFSFFLDNWCRQENNCKASKVWGHPWRVRQPGQQGPRQGQGLCAPSGIVPCNCWDLSLRTTIQRNFQLLGRKGFTMVTCFNEALLINFYLCQFLSTVAHQYLYLAFIGFPCPGCGPLPGLCALLAAGLHDTRCQNERSDTDHRPPAGTRGHSGQHSGKGTHVGDYCT